jgi:hypothetical protein
MPAEPGIVREIEETIEQALRQMLEPRSGWPSGVRKPSRYTLRMMAKAAAAVFEAAAEKPPSTRKIS